eukprot:CCRYP_019787-RA/>CCRYP_019787-RA protein AED:0.47 eAED:0.47 QI:0/-1/0/1/-1/1/1/0/66
MPRPSTLGPKTSKTSSASNNFSVTPPKQPPGTSNCKRTRRYPIPTSKGANTNANPHAAALHQPRYL